MQIAINQFWEVNLHGTLNRLCYYNTSYGRVGTITVFCKYEEASRTRTKTKTTKRTTTTFKLIERDARVENESDEQELDKYRVD